LKEYESQDSGLNQTFSFNHKKTSVSKETLETTTLDNQNELYRLKRQEENVKQISESKKNYNPYNLNDYIQMKNQYQRHYRRLGGLGSNVGSIDWNEKQLRKDKMNQYAVPY